MLCLEGFCFVSFLSFLSLLCGQGPEGWLGRGRHSGKGQQPQEVPWEDSKCTSGETFPPGRGRNTGRGWPETLGGFQELADVPRSNLFRWDFLGM